MSVDLRHFRSFVAVAEEGHIGRAAQRLFITQPALSRQMQQLEREVGAPVLVRTPRGVDLTAAGTELLARARVALEAAEDALAVGRLEVPRGTLTVGLPLAGGRERWFGLVQAFLRRYPVNAFFQPDAGTIDYGAAKAALLNLSKSLAQEFGAKGIHVNCVSPGPVSTELWLGDHGVAATVAAAAGVDADTARKTVVESIGGFATGRFTTPEEVATLVVLLASQRTANVTGANYVIDGGLIKTT